MQLNWEAIGAVGELLGSAAVLITLIYLALQVRHSRDLLEENHKVALSKVHWDRTQSRLDFNWMTIQSDRLVNTLEKFFPGGDSPLESRLEKLTPLEIRTLRAHHANILLHQENNLYQRELGLIDREILEITTNTISILMPAWIALDIEIPNRVRDWHETHSSPVSDT